MPEAQAPLFDDFHTMFSPNGTISPETFKSIAASPKFNMQATQFEIGDIQQTRDAGALPLASAPNAIG